jgi:hypothetical protein
MYVLVSGATGSMTLQTQGDAFSESLSRSGNIDVLVTNGTPFGDGHNTANFGFYAAVWVYAAPIPEPGAWGLIAAGLGLLPLVALKRQWPLGGRSLRSTSKGAAI